MSHHASGPNFGFPRGDARLDMTDLYAFPKPGAICPSILVNRNAIGRAFPKRKCTFSTPDALPWLRLRMKSPHWCKALYRQSGDAIRPRFNGVNWLRRRTMATATITTRPPLPPFTSESAIQKVRLAEDSWNTRDPGKVALAYAIDSRWRNRSEFVNGRDEITTFLSRKWVKELDYRLIKELWAFTGNRIAVRFAYE